MDKFLCPERLEVDSESPTATQDWKHWYQVFQNFILSAQESDSDKICILINHISPKVYEYIMSVKHMIML